MTRKAETDKPERWDRDVAAENDLDEMRDWVVWGVGPPPDRAAAPEAAERPGEPGNDIARQIAEGNDPEWAESGDGGNWVVILRADEDHVDEWALEDEAVRGYAPYLINREDAEAKPERLRGVLRSDVVRRRKEKRFDAARPS
ncbi:MAG TPA: hypothetical protein VHL78_10710 [Actinomycetota bacterium]|nr:hypothetical protein [Actinomycetota bacterium]